MSEPSPNNYINKQIYVKKNYTVYSTIKTTVFSDSTVETTVFLDSSVFILLL